MKSLGIVFILLGGLAGCSNVSSEQWQRCEHSCGSLEGLEKVALGGKCYCRNGAVLSWPE